MALIYIKMSYDDFRQTVFELASKLSWHFVYDLTPSKHHLDVYLGWKVDDSLLTREWTEFVVVKYDYLLGKATKFSSRFYENELDIRPYNIWVIDTPSWFEVSFWQPC